GIVSAAITNAVPLAGLRPGQARLQIEDEGDGTSAPTADVRIASPDYFSTLGVPVLRGRAFGPQDHETAERVVVVNAAATRFWGDRDPVGSRVSVDGGRTWNSVVGIVGDVRYSGLDIEPVAQVYRPLAQAGGNLAGQILARTVGDPAATMQAVRNAI